MTLRGRANCLSVVDTAKPRLVKKQGLDQLSTRGSVVRPCREKHDHHLPTYYAGRGAGGETVFPNVAFFRT